MTTRFITVEVDDSVALAARLVETLNPDRVVIHAGGELFYVVAARDLGLYDSQPQGVTVGQALDLTSIDPAEVVGPDIAGARFDSDVPLVVVEEGLVTDVVAPALVEAPRRHVRRERMAEAAGDESLAAEPQFDRELFADPGEPATANGGGGAAAADETGPIATAVRVEYPASVSLREVLSLLIAISTDTAATNAIPIAAGVGDQIDVVVSPRSGFVVEGKAEGQLAVTGDPEALPIQIKLRATALGRGRVTVFVFRQGTALGSLTVTPEVVPEGEPTGDRSTANVGLTASPPSEADLELVILEQRDATGRPELHYRLSARERGLGLNLKPFGPVPLEIGPGPYFTDLYREIEALPVGTDSEKAIATRRLHAIGSTLFTQLFPADLQTLIWAVRDRIDTVWVQSDEPWVPWEICRLQGTEGGTIVEGPFFCEAFKMTRWVPGSGTTTELTLSKIGVIAPPDSGLDSTPLEVAMLKGLGSDRRTVTDVVPEYIPVLKAFSEATYDGIHFTGHGKFPDQTNPTKAEITLMGGQKLRPTDLSGVAANLGVTKPLVFFNACQIGRQSKALTGVGGWATAMVKAGVGAFVGSHWDVTDDLALTFATRFYEQLLAGESIGAATRTARLAIRDTGDPTWLAYTVFAEPLARAAI